jgi:hypothetical protein
MSMLLDYRVRPDSELAIRGLPVHDRPLCECGAARATSLIEFDGRVVGFYCARCVNKAFNDARALLLARLKRRGR